MPIETLTYLYTTNAEIERLYSVLGVQDRADDDYDGSAEDDVMDDLCAWATDTVNLYVSERYDPQYLANNLWVRQAATVIAAWMLSQRRANPAQFTDWYDKIIELLEKIAAGTLDIPRMPARADSLPAMSNYVIQDWSRVAKIRVEDTISTGGKGPTHTPAINVIYNPWG